jgi:hypothetical protein
MSYMKKADFKNSRASFVSSTVCNTKTYRIALLHSLVQDILKTKYISRNKLNNHKIGTSLLAASSHRQYNLCGHKKEL